jgi:hypothetical protein
MLALAVIIGIVNTSAAPTNFVELDSPNFNVRFDPGGTEAFDRANAAPCP